ncbi:MAG: Fur family transcriptional regulator [Pseudomonadota bacterium]
MAHHAQLDVKLTKNQALVMGALSDADGALSAYTILDRLRDDGFRAPLQVYRALEKLVEIGLVHRLESLNAFVACRHDECQDQGQTVFMICEPCGKTIEITDEATAKRLKAITKDAAFSVESTTVELRGSCKECAEG